MDSLEKFEISASFDLMKDNFLIIAATFWSKLLRILLCRRSDHEILMLKKELQILSRQIKTPKLTNWERLFFVSLFKANTDVINSVVTLKPSTIISWHRNLEKKKSTNTKESE